MKTYKNIFEPAVEIENIKQCIIESSKNGKMKRHDVRKAVENVDREAEIVRNMMKRHETKIGTYSLTEITDGSKRKKRNIAKPKFRYDQIVQYVLLSQLKPIVTRSLYEYAHGSLEKRGTLQSAKAISRWIKNDPKGTRYCLQMDVHHCYPSVDQEILIKKFHEKIKDDDFNIENDKVIRASPYGLAPGAPTSVWYIHFLFTPFDHWITAHDVCGYLFYRDRTILRKEKMIRATRKAGKMARKEKITFYDCEQLLSRIGDFKHVDVYNVYRNRIKPKVDVKKLKQTISKHARKENEKNELEKSNGI